MIKTNWLKFASIVYLSFLMVGCDRTPTPNTPRNDRITPTGDVPPSTEGESIPNRFEPSTTKLPERVPSTETGEPITGEVPTQLLDSILKDLSGRTNVARENITVIHDQVIVWSDGSLGCPQPGVMYTQALVSGYWVILEIDGKKFDYRATDKGYFFLCENESPPISPPSTPRS